MKTKNRNSVKNLCKVLSQFDQELTPVIRGRNGEFALPTSFKVDHEHKRLLIEVSEPISLLIKEEVQQ